MDLSNGYQIRLVLAEEFSKAVRAGEDNSSLKPLNDVLESHDAALSNQLDAFEAFIEKADAGEIEADADTLELTRATVVNPEKIAKYSKVFTVVVNETDILEDTPESEVLWNDLKAMEGNGIVQEARIIPVRPFHSAQVRK